MKNGHSAFNLKKQKESLAKIESGYNACFEITRPKATHIENKTGAVWRKTTCSTLTAYPALLLGALLTNTKDVALNTLAIVPLS